MDVVIKKTLEKKPEKKYLIKGIIEGIGIGLALAAALVAIWVLWPSTPTQSPNKGPTPPPPPTDTNSTPGMVMVKTTTTGKVVTVNTNVVEKNGKKWQDIGQTPSNKVVVATAKPTAETQKLKQPADTKIKRRRLKPGAANRLHTKPQKIITTVQVTGRAENADWGLSGIRPFVLTYLIDCDAEILEKSETPGGEIKVVEKRTFNNVVEQLNLGKMEDARLSLYDTLPITLLLDTTKVFAPLLLCSSYTRLSYTQSRLFVKIGIDMIDGGLRAIDKQSVPGILRDILSMFNVNQPDKIIKQVNDFLCNRVKLILKPSELEGKSYKITYYQDKTSGSPLRMGFTYADGSPIKTQEEFFVLRRANAFLDSKFVPDKNCSPGDTWRVDSSEFEGILDPYVDGGYYGEVNVERIENDKQGNWQIVMKSNNLSIRSDNGLTTGEVYLKDGHAQVDADNAIIKTMIVRGRGKMKNITPHHLLFNSRFEGDCTFVGSLVTKDKDNKNEKSAKK